MQTNTRHMGRALMLAIEHAGLTQSALSEASGVTQSGIARVVAGHRRPDPGTVRAIVHAACWTRPGDPARIMIGHLRDEMHRAEMASDQIALYPLPGTRAPGSARAALRMLADHASDPDLSAIICDLAALVNRGLDEKETPALRVAECASEYGASSRTTAKAFRQNLTDAKTQDTGNTQTIRKVAKNTQKQ